MTIVNYRMVLTTAELTAVVCTLQNLLAYLFPILRVSSLVLWFNWHISISLVCLTSSMYLFSLVHFLFALGIPVPLCRQLHRSCTVSGSLLRPTSLMKPDQRLEAHLIRQPVSVVALDGDGELVPLQQCPRLPPRIAVPVQWVLGVPPARPDLALPLRHGIHRPQADEGLITAILPRLLRDDPKQRALGAAVWLLQGQLLIDKIPFSHISNIFSAPSGAEPGWWSSAHPAVPVVQGPPTQRTRKTGF